MLRVTFLGTAASRPTVGHNVSVLSVERDGDLMLFDCGEGTPRQMMRFGTGFTVNDIFFTHLHAHPFLGLTHCSAPWRFKVVKQDSGSGARQVGRPCCTMSSALAMETVRAKLIAEMHDVP